MNFKEFQQQARRTCPDLINVYQNRDNNQNFAELNQLYYIKFNPTSVEGVLKKDMYASPEILNLLHTRIGIVTETEELMEAIAKKDKVGVGEELTDKLWYIGNDLHFCLKAGFIDQAEFNQFVNIKFEGKLQATDTPTMNQTLNDWFNAVVYNEGKLLDQIKKLYAYNKPFDKTVYITRLNYLLNAINNVSISCKVDLNEYMDKVIKKLKARYPEKFFSDSAINRDHGAERVMLEK